MTDKNCTTIDQSRKLLELGIDVNTADMYWKNGVSDKYIQCFTPFVCGDYQDGLDFDYDIPAWSLSALIGLMPKVITIKATEHSAYFYFLEWEFANDNSLRYVGHDGKCLVDIYSDHDDEKQKDLVDTAFEMVCWLLENKKLRVQLPGISDL